MLQFVSLMITVNQFQQQRVFINTEKYAPNLLFCLGSPANPVGGVIHL